MVLIYIKKLDYSLKAFKYYYYPTLIIDFNNHFQSGKSLGSGKKV